MLHAKVLPKRAIAGRHADKYTLIKSMICTRLDAPLTENAR